MALAGGKWQRERSDDSFGELVLDVKQVSERRLRGVRREQSSGGCIRQLRCDPHLIASAKQSSGHDDVHVGFSRYCFKVGIGPNFAAAMLERTTSFFRPREGRRQGVWQAEGEKVSVRIGPQHPEGQDNQPCQPLWLCRHGADDTGHQKR